jgi:hypothetical protein
MHSVLMVLGAVLFPVVPLLLLIGLGRLEETLDPSVSAKTRTKAKEPKPLRSVPVESRPSGSEERPVRVVGSPSARSAS